MLDKISFREQWKDLYDNGTNAHKQLNSVNLARHNVDRI